MRTKTGRVAVVVLFALWLKDSLISLQRGSGQLLHNVPVMLDATSCACYVSMVHDCLTKLSTP